MTARAVSVLSEHRDSILRCAACHDRCLAWTVELVASGDQALAVSRIAGAIRRAEEGIEPWGPELGDLVFATVDDSLPEEVCLFAGRGHRIRPYRRAARGRVHDLGYEPSWVRAAVERVRSVGSLFGPFGSWLGSIEATDVDAPVLVLDGASWAFAAGTEASCRRLLSAVGPEPGVLRVTSVGTVEDELGLETEARSAAGALAEALAGPGRGPIVTPDPDLALWLRDRAPDLGVVIERPVRHVSEHLVDAIDALGPFNSFAGRVVFHDPPALARGLGVTEAPRRLLTRVPDLVLVEAATSGRLAASAGSVLAGVHPASGEVARDRLSDLMAVRPDAIVTASPSQLASLRGLDPKVPVFDLFEFLDRLLATEGNG